MKKRVVIINGKGGVGKDTLCNIIGKKYAIRNVSSITPIKKIAQMGGWKGGKENKDRKFLADLKKLFIDYNDLPFLYLKEEMESFLINKDDILFIHIREIEEIKRFVQYTTEKGIVCKTLLVTREKEKNKIYGVKAMSYSAHLMKGYKGTLFVLYLSYLGWYILTIVITAVVQVFLPIPLVIEILMSALSVYLFSAELQTSVAVLFEEINLENNNV